MTTEENNQNEEAEYEAQEEETELELEVEEEEQISMSKSEWEKFQQTQGSLKRQVKELRKSSEPNEPKQSSTNELNDTDLNYLDIKGVFEAEDVKIIENFVKNTGQTAREALRDDYVTSKLSSNKSAREVQVATPSGSNRGGNQVGDLASALAKYETTKELPTDYKLRTEVINAFVSKGHGSNKPSWQ